MILRSEQLMVFRKPDRIEERKVRVAVVACGRISGKLVEAIEKHTDQIELVGVCDNNTVRLRSAQPKTGARCFATLNALLGQSNANLVVLSIRNELRLSASPKLSGT